MLLYTAADMKNTEAAADARGHSYAEMMRLAGEGAAEVILSRFELKGKSCVVFCGRGNNGGDGYVAASRLLQKDVLVTAVSLGGEPTSEHALQQYRKAVKNGLYVLDYRDKRVEKLCERAELVVDAICGTGFSGSLREQAAVCCDLINNVSCPVVALDLPTGVCSDDGTVADGSVGADLTVTFHGGKPGQFTLPGRTHCGEVVCVDIGIAEAADAPSEEHIHVDKEYVVSRIPSRPEECNKGTFGRLLAVLGSEQYMGAALLATEAALRCGTGYVQLASTAKVCDILLPSVPESIMTRCPADHLGAIDGQAAEIILKQAEKATAVLVGCGLGVTPGTAHLLERLLQNYELPMVIDADGINLLAKNIDMLKKRLCDVILTPHPAEFARLLGVSTKQVLAERLRLGRSFATEYGVTLLLKGSCTMVFSPDGTVRYVDSGTPGLAKAGSGDVLAGLIGGLLAQGLAPADAAACGGWLHGRAGSIAAQQHSVTAVLPRDVVTHLCDAFLECGR
ncbi:MAG: NAD(P)H-hydrate dehydratase [Oscillospiraceae bacterium]|nr:NAD(P)H-hydrate dehydratase [Oscillospiraceae bacterium]